MGFVHIGDQVRQGKAFVWLPRDSHDVSEDAELPKPFLVKPSNLKDLKVSCPEASRFSAVKFEKTSHCSKKG